MGKQPLHLEIDGHFRPPASAKAAGLSKLAAQFTIGAFQQRSGAHKFARDATQGIEGNRLLKIALQGCHRFWLAPPRSSQTSASARAPGRASRLDKWHWLVPTTVHAALGAPLH